MTENTENQATVSDSATSAENNQQQPVKRKGAPAKPIQWPTGNFTVRQVLSCNTLSKGTVVMKLKAAQNSGKIVRLSETVKSGRVGKPEFVYSVA